MLTLWYLILGWKEYNKPSQKPLNQSAGKPADPIKKPDLIPQKKDVEPTKPTDVRKPEPPKSIPIEPRPPTLPPRNVDLNNKVGDLPKVPEIPKASAPKDIPKVPDSPKPAFPAKVPELPKMPDLPKRPTDFSDPSSSLKTLDALKISDPPKMPELPKFTPKTPESPKLPELPKFAPKTPESPKLPEPSKFAPKTPETPKLPEPSKFAPKTPESPKLPEPPKFAPKTPESPKLPEPSKFTPKTPESSKAPQFYKGSPKPSDSSFNQEPFGPFKPDTPVNQKPTARGDELFGFGNNLKGSNSPGRSPGNLRDLSYGKGELPETDDWVGPKKPFSVATRYMEESVISNPDSLESEEEEEEEGEEDDRF